MKQFKLIEEVGWMLTDEAKADKSLNAVDKNLLAILQFIEDGKAEHASWFKVLVKHPNNKWNVDGYTSLEKYFSEFEVPVAYCTLNRSINKLQRLGYIEYKTGWYNNLTGEGMTPMIKILKGTIPIHYSDIATANEKEKEKEKYKENKSTYSISDLSYKEKDKEKEKSDLELECILKRGGDELELFDWLQRYPTWTSWKKLAQFWEGNEVMQRALRNWWENRPLPFSDDDRA